MALMTSSKTIFSIILIWSFVCIILVQFTFNKEATIDHTADCPIYFKSKNPPYVVHSPLNFSQFDDQEKDQEHSIEVLSSKLIRLHHMSEDLNARLLKSSQLMTNNGHGRLLNVQDAVQHVIIRSNVIQLEIESLLEQLKIERWRKNAANSIQNSILTEIIELQNPTSCSNARYLLCKITNYYGFASGIHDILWCFVRGYYTSRTVIMDLNIQYFQKEPWNKFFEPVSELDNFCLSRIKIQMSKNPNFSRNNHMIDQVIIEEIKLNDPYYRQFLGYLPKEYSSKICAISKDPIAFFHSIFIKYIMRPSKYLNNLVNETKLNLGFNSPIIGLHIRRSDKVLIEARKHEISEYMDHVIDFYNKLELSNGPLKNKKIYIATDDPSAIVELRSKFPEFQIHSNEKVASEASNLETRYTSSSLRGLLVDLFLLGHCDMVVGTYSSGMSRLALELKIGHDPSTIKPGISLDVPFHYDLIFNPVRQSMYYHRPKGGNDASDWSLQPGDKLYELEVPQYSDWWSQSRDVNVYPGYIRGSDFYQTRHKYFPVFLTKQIIPVH